MGSDRSSLSPAKPIAGPRSGKVFRDGATAFYVMPWRCPDWCTTVHGDKLDWPPTHSTPVAAFKIDDRTVVTVDIVKAHTDDLPKIGVGNSFPGIEFADRGFYVSGGEIGGFAALLEELGHDDLAKHIRDASDIINEALEAEEAAR